MLKIARTFNEKQYLNLVKSVLIKGVKEERRNGMVYTSIGENMKFSLNDNSIPFPTTKKFAWKSCIKELLWFIRGETNNEILQKQNVKIWNGNASRAFLDSRGLTNLKENDLGPIYGHQWRYFNAPYNSCNDDYTDKGVDQLQNVIDMLKDPNEKYSRRIVLSAWNPCQLNEMALPPCHVLFQFNVLNDDELHCTLYQRSGDVGLGIPFNIVSYSALTHLIAHHCDLKPKSFTHFIGNAHIYEEHIDALTKQLKNEPLEEPRLIIKNKRDNIDDYILEDFDIINYEYVEEIKMPMCV